MALSLGALTIAAMAGCGKSAPTKAQYVSRANAVCVTENQELKQLAEQGRPTLGEIVRETIRIRERANRRLRVIAVPSGQNRPREWLHLREVAVASQRKIFYETKRGSRERAAAGRAYNQAVEAAVKIAVPYGLTSCVHFATS